ncbi:MAG TPA: PAS sensor protein [Syntrophus sp. (in: bacteria)]|nr:PAS sensor protein [Syntrophus sp. (in: bacteria)]
MNDTIRILIVEDLPTDAELCEREVRQALPRSVFLRVETGEEFLAAMESFAPDLILSDYSLPRFDGMTALALARQHAPETPFIILTGSTNEETAVACMKAGAWDYVIKEHIRRLRQAVIAALEQKRIRRERLAATEALHESANLLRIAGRMARLGGWIVNLSENRVIWSEEVATIHDMPPGYSPRLEEGINYYSEEWREKIEKAYGACTREGAPYDEEMEIITARGRRIWVRTIGEAIRDEAGTIIMLQGALQDITDRKLAEGALQDSFDKLRKTIGAAIRTLAATVEMRDPYTAGHQQRVAGLARRIAREMSLDNDRILGLGLAAVIHDIGKISVPAEILSKPTKLTNIEFSLIKNHTQAAYDILKDMEFPWPIAEIVYQHHERLDGAGYPRGLKGEEISLEAKIIAVSDVVEAMSSHRPYRPGLGIDVALGEIKKNRGVFYDPAVVDACLRLFLERGFTFS